MKLPSIPVIPTPYKILAVVLAFIAYTFFVWHKGYDYRDVLVENENAKEVAAAFERGKKSVKITERVVTQYVDRVVTVKEEAIRYVDRVQYVVKDSDNFTLPDGVVGLYDGSLQAGLSFGPIGSDGTSREAVDGAGVQGQEVEADFRTLLEVTAHNNGVCKANTIKLESLQAWVMAQEKLHRK